MSTVVSVRVDRRLKEEAERLGINIHDLIEKALREEVERRRREEFGRIVDILLKGMEPVSEEDFIRVVKEWRRRR